MIRPITTADIPDILAIAKANQFEPEELAVVNSTLEEHFSRDSFDIWLLAAVDGKKIGVIYCTSEVMTNGTWNILMLLVHPDHHRQGYGSQLVKSLEQRLAEQQARLIIVETSSLEDFEQTRCFYKKIGYAQAAVIRDFYDAGNDKLIFSKSLSD